MLWSKSLRSILILAFLTLLAVACGGTPSVPVEQESPAAEEAQETELEDTAVPESSQPESSEEELTVTLGIEVEDLDAHTTTTTDSNIVRNHIYDTLVAWTEGFEFGPGLAESWDLSSDGRTYTFHLRSGIEFHDGTPFNAEAVKFNLDRVRSLDSAAAATLAMITEVEVVDEYTVNVTTDEPFGPFLRHLATTSGSMQSPTAIEEFGDDYGVNPVGTGPFKFVEWIRGQHIVLERNPDYWGEQPSYDRLVFIPVTEEAVRTTLLTTGEADVVTRLPPQDVPGLQGNPDVEIREELSNRIIFFYINTNRPMMDNVLVRQALNHAIDQEGILQSILDGSGQVAESVLAQRSFGHASPETSYEYDPERARQLLEEAGFDFNRTITMWSPQGRYVRDSQTAEVVQGQLQAIGLNVELQVFGDLAAYFGSLDSGDYDLALIGWSATSGDADWGLYRLMHSSLAGQFFNFFWLDDPVVDDLLERGRLSTDQEERLQIYAELQEYERQQAYGLLVVDQAFFTGIRSGVEGVIIRPTEEIDLRHVTLP